MVDIILHSVGGFLAALALALIAMPYFSRRASEKAVRRLHETMPFSTAEVEAQKDQLKAEHAVKLRKVELESEKNAEIVGKQKIELRTAREKLEGANKIMKANKLAIEEMREKQDELNEKLRHSETKYASLDQRARQAIREKNEYQLQVKRLEKKSSAAPAVVPGSLSLQETPELSASGLPIADASIALHPKIEAQLEDLKKKLSEERARSDKLTAQINELTRSNLKEIADDDVPADADMDVLRDKLFNLAADISVVTAKLEGEDSTIHQILEDGDKDASALSERIKALLEKTAESTVKEEPAISEESPKKPEPEQEKAPAKTVRRAPRKRRAKPTLPKAEGLDLQKPKRTRTRKPKTTAEDKTVKTNEDPEETPA